MGEVISRNVASLNIPVHDVQTYCIMNTEETSENIFTCTRLSIRQD